MRNIVQAKAEMLNLSRSGFRANISMLLLIVSGLFFVLWAGLGVSFRDSENILTAKFCLPVAIGFGLIFAGSLVNTAWRSFAFWSSLGLVGQSASLQMIDAGKLIHFQHYRSLSDLLNKDVVVLTVFAVQIILVTFAISKRFSAIKIWVSSKFSAWQIILIAGFLILAGSAVTPDISIYLGSVFTGAIVQYINLANIILIAWSVPADSIDYLKQITEPFFGKSQESSTSKLDTFSILSALFVVVLAGSLSYFVYQNHPHVPDETQYLFQANYMAAGQLTVKAPLVPEAFSMYMVPTNADRWFSIFSPGWSAVLAVGVKIGAAWLVNPLLAGLCVLLAYLFFNETYTQRFARMAILLLCFSPWFVFMAMSFMSHIFTLFCALSAAVLFCKSLKRERLLYIFASGLMTGILSLTRPLDGLIVALLLGVFTLLSFPNWKTKLTNGFALVAGTISTAAIIFPYNKAVTGDELLSPLDAYYSEYFSPKVMALGFGADRGFHWGLDAFPGHSPFEAIINAALNVFLVNTELFGWGIGSLLFGTCFLVAGKPKKKDVWIFAVISSIILGYSLSWYHGGPDFGARYWFLCIIPLIALTVRGIDWLGRNLNQNNTESNPRIILTVSMLCLMSFVSYFPWRSADKYYGYLEMKPGIRQLAQQHNFSKSLILISGEEHPDYQSAWIYNPLNFSGDAPIYAWNKDLETRTRLLKAYADRPVWLVDGPTINGGNYKVVDGPIAAQGFSSVENR
jgi:hypothetical protein